MATIAKILLLVSVLMCAACAGWTREDTYRHAAMTGLTAVDYAQTMKISREPENYYEMNPILGEHPGEAEVTAYFIGSYVIKTGVSMVLPPEYRKWWQYVMIGMSAGCVANNLSIGLGIGF